MRLIESKSAFLIFVEELDTGLASATAAAMTNASALLNSLSTADIISSAVFTLITLTPSNSNGSVWPAMTVTSAPLLRAS